MNLIFEKIVCVFLFVAALFVAASSGMALAQSTGQPTNAPISLCQAVAGMDHLPGWENGGWPGGVLRADAGLPIVKAAAGEGAVTELSSSQVRITYVNHSTFRIENADGLTIATDFAGFAGRNIIPDVVTMNHAHGTHFTVAPDPRIDHVLRGWGKEGEPARHNLTVGETLIRNVTTNIDNQWAGFEPDGNSIFIFETAGLCIGHLGHLHHLLTDRHYAAIGRLDVLMVPVDGGYTLNVQDMNAIAKRLQASVILPMHWFGLFSLERFLDEARQAFPVDVSRESTMVLSLNTLPVQPTVMVLQPEGSFGAFDGD